MEAGFCAITDGAGDCRVGRSGSWPIGDFSACVERCKTCDRCRYISHSPRLKDCSWYASCNRPLRQEPSGFSTQHVHENRPPIPLEPPWRNSEPSHGRKFGARRGYCSTTLVAASLEMHCAIGDSGILEGVSSLRMCRQRCEACPRCAVVSWSASRRDCSWYAQCDLDDLRRPPRAAPDYVSVRVRPVPSALPPPLPQPAGARPLSLAVATLVTDFGASKAGVHIGLRYDDQ